jgi:hypothetical protein
MRINRPVKTSMRISQTKYSHAVKKEVSPFIFLLCMSLFGGLLVLVTTNFKANAYEENLNSIYEKSSTETVSKESKKEVKGIFDNKDPCVLSPCGAEECPVDRGLTEGGIETDYSFTIKYKNGKAEIPPQEKYQDKNVKGVSVTKGKERINFRAIKYTVPEKPGTAFDAALRHNDKPLAMNDKVKVPLCFIWKKDGENRVTCSIPANTQKWNWMSGLFNPVYTMDPEECSDDSTFCGEYNGFYKEELDEGGCLTSINFEDDIKPYADTGPFLTVAKYDIKGPNVSNSVSVYNLNSGKGNTNPTAIKGRAETLWRSTAQPGIQNVERNPLIDNAIDTGITYEISSDSNIVGINTECDECVGFFGKLKCLAGNISQWFFGDEQNDDSGIEQESAEMDGYSWYYCQKGKGPCPTENYTVEVKASAPEGSNFGSFNDNPDAAFDRQMALAVNPYVYEKLYLDKDIKYKDDINHFPPGKDVKIVTNGTLEFKGRLNQNHSQKDFKIYNTMNADRSYWQQAVMYLNPAQQNIDSVNLSSIIEEELLASWEESETTCQ